MQVCRGHCLQLTSWYMECRDPGSERAYARIQEHVQHQRALVTIQMRHAHDHRPRARHAVCGHCRSSLAGHLTSPGAPEGSLWCQCRECVYATSVPGLLLRSGSPDRLGYPSAELDQQAQRGELVLAGCIMLGNDPEWVCPSCRARFGHPDKPAEALPQRTVEDWAALLPTMLPQPVRTNAAGELLGGDPVLVIVGGRADGDSNSRARPPVGR